MASLIKLGDSSCNRCLTLGIFLRCLPFALRFAEMCFVNPESPQGALFNCPTTSKIGDTCTASCVPGFVAGSKLPRVTCGSGGKVG